MLPSNSKTNGLTLYIPPAKKVLPFRAVFNDYTGYGLHACYIAQSFQRFGYDVKGIPIRLPEDDQRTWSGSADILKCVQKGVEQEGSELVLSFVDMPVNEDQWLFTMYETTQMCQKSLNGLNQARMVIVPSVWCQNNFDAQGVKVPMQVVPLGVNLDLFISPNYRSDFCVFGTAGNAGLSVPLRKNIDVVTSAFLEAFPTEADVRLYIKVQEDCPVDTTDDYRVSLVRKTFSEARMAEWYQSLTAYISTSHAEAFGQMNLQAMACGVPVICCPFGGVLDYHSEHVGYNVDFDLVRPRGCYEELGFWAEPNLDSLIDQMRRVYRNRQEALDKGAQARQVAERYDWDVVNKKLELTLKKSDFWGPSRRKPVAAPVMEVTQLPEITVVITNYRRPDKVAMAFESCLKAGIRHIVVSASGCDLALREVHEQFKKKHRSVTIDAIEGDRGCNEMWLRGVLKARTEWVHILHDDDILLPEFSILHEKISNGAGFIHWDGAKHSFPPELLQGHDPVYKTFPDRNNDVYSTDILWPFLLSPQGLTLSPVSGVFKKQHLVDVLEECERELVGDTFHYTPTLMVGNDLMIWLRATEKYAKFEYINRPLISYGHWIGSCSYADSQKGLVRLREIYASTRDYYLRGPELQDSDPVMVHAYSEFTPKAEDAKRYSDPVPLWEQQYATSKWIKMPILDESLPKFFHDSTGRTIPFVKDLVDYVFSHSDSNICILTNKDILPSPSLTRQLCHTLKHYPAAYSFRRDVDEFCILDDNQIRMNTKVYSGLDLFAITREWWAENKKDYPDLLYATEAWDYLLRLLMAERGAREFHYLIYHVAHVAESIRNSCSNSQAHNREFSEKFLRARNIEPYWLSRVNLNPR